MKHIELQRTSTFAILLLILCSMWLITDCAAQEIRFDYDVKADFSRYKTYLWIDCERPANSKLNHEAVIAMVNRRLAVIGLIRVDKQQADLYLSYRGEIEDCVSYEVDNFSNGGTIERKHQEATLTLKLIEATTSRLIWVGRGTYTLSNKPADNGRRIHHAITKILKKYPSNNR